MVPRVAVVGAVAGSAAAVLALLLTHAPRDRAADLRFRDVPLRPAPKARPLVEVGGDVWTSVTDRFVPRIRKGERWITSASVCLHCLRLRGSGAVFPDEVLPTSAAVLRALTTEAGSKAAFGTSIVAPNRFGLRFRPRSLLPQSSTPSDESHTDQILAGLLEFGTRLDQAVVIGERALPLRDAVADAVTNFSLAQPEIEWSTIILLSVLPPQRSWTNKFREAFTFDALCSEVLDRDPSRSSCGGAHLFHAMVLFQAVDAFEPILERQSRLRLNEHLRGLLAKLESTQAADGSWGLNWHNGQVDAPDESEPLAARLLVTGHVAETLTLLDAAHGCGDEVLRRAGTYLLLCLTGQIGAFDLATEYCPMAHAAVAVDRLRR